MCRGLTIKGEAGQADGHDHGEGDAEVVPVCGVVARPDGPHGLAARKEGPAEHEGPVAIAAIHRPAALLQPLQSRPSVLRCICHVIRLLMLLSGSPLCH